MRSSCPDKFSCHVIFEVKFLQMLFCTSFTKQFQYIRLEQLPDCYAGKPLFTITVALGHLALKEDDVPYTFCRPAFYVVQLCYKVQRTTPVRYRKILKQKFNQFRRLAKRLLLISSILTIVTERGVQRKGFQLSSNNFSNCSKEKYLQTSEIIHISSEQKRQEVYFHPLKQCLFSCSVSSSCLGWELS